MAVFVPRHDDLENDALVLVAVSHGSLLFRRRFPIQRSGTPQVDKALRSALWLEGRFGKSNSTRHTAERSDGRIRRSIIPSFFY
jgi:hypothetical protein